MQVILACNMNNSHWITCNIDLDNWVIYIYDSFADCNDAVVREQAIIPHRALLPVIMKQAGYFDHFALPPKSDIFSAVRLPPEKVAQQVDNDSCSMFSLTYMDNIVQGMPIRKSFGQKDISNLHCQKVLKFFANGVDAE